MTPEIEPAEVTRMATMRRTTERVKKWFEGRRSNRTPEEKAALEERIRLYDEGKRGYKSGSGGNPTLG